MKKHTILFILFSLVLFSLYSQQNGQETVTKLKMEQDISQRIENVLEPYIGKCIVTVNLTMRYPALIKALLASGNEEKYYGDLEVSRSKAAIISQQKKSFENEQTQILKKEVTVFVTRTLDEKMKIFIKQNIVNILGLNTDTGDVLVIKTLIAPIAKEKVESTKQSKITTTPSPIKEKVSTGNKFGFILSILNLIALLFFIYIFRSSFLQLFSNRSNVNVTGFDKLIRLQGKKSSEIGGGSSGNKQTESSSTKPLFVRLVEEKADKEFDSSLDFTYLENLSTEGFIKLISNEKPEDVANLLSNLSPEFNKKFIELYTGDISNILKFLLKDKQKTKTEIDNTQKKFQKKYQEMLAKDKLHYNSIDSMIHVINILSPEKSQFLAEKIKVNNATAFKSIRKQILLMEDILTFDEDTIEKIITSISHDLLIEFILSTDSDIKQKFFKFMSPRAIAIAEEDMENYGEIEDTHKKVIVSEALNKIREILSYR
ncbi:MAG: hypothetical protein K8S23_13130 [Candidatus Cloacimonetes bacterium]|nr:hypothetical protein [Candidatus Cloacimonadota bacterium]